jgi:cytochrome P450
VLLTRTTRELTTLEQLIENPTLISDAVEECLRIASNGYFTFARVATRDTEVGGGTVIAMALLVLLGGSQSILNGAP